MNASKRDGVKSKHAEKVKDLIRALYVHSGKRRRKVCKPFIFVH